MASKIGFVVILGLVSGAVGVRDNYVAEDMHSSAQRTASPCACNGLSLESQIVRMVELSYPENKVNETLVPAAGREKNLQGCYDVTPLQYDIPSTIGNNILKGVGSLAGWGGSPRLLVGKCIAKQDVCIVAFSGASNPAMVASIASYGPADLRRDRETGRVDEIKNEPLTSDVYRFHASYWSFYKAMRSQVGAQLDEKLAGCSQIYATGHSIGSAMAGLWQWDAQEKPIEQITIGQNLAWFGKAPDVGCRGRRLHMENDPVPALRPFVDKRDGSVIRHSLIPAQSLHLDPDSSSYVSTEPTACDADVPYDPECQPTCSIWSWHYNRQLATQLAENHYILPYVDAVDQAFP